LAVKKKISGIIRTSDSKNGVIKRIKVFYDNLTKEELEISKISTKSSSFLSKQKSPLPTCSAAKVKIMGSLGATILIGQDT
jgi:hypothetical protein